MGMGMCGLAIATAVIACAEGAGVETDDSEMPSEPNSVLPASADDASSDRAVPKRADGGASSVADASSEPPALPSGTVVVSKTNLGEVTANVVLTTASTVEGRMNDYEETCPTEQQWEEGTFPFATRTFHNPPLQPVWIEVVADVPGVAFAAYEGAVPPMTPTERRACDISSWGGGLVDTVELKGEETKLLFVTSAAPVGPNVTTGTIPLRFKTTY